MKKTAEKLLGVKSSDPISFNTAAESIPSNPLGPKKSIPTSERIKGYSPVKVKPKRTITITSPFSSEVYMNNKLVGKTPLENFIVPITETPFINIKIKDGAYTKVYFANYWNKNHETINHEPNDYKSQINEYYLEMNWPGFSIITPYIFNFDISFDSPDVKDTRGECTNWWMDEDSKTYGDSSDYSDENFNWSFPCRDFKAPPGKYSFKIFIISIMEFA